MATTGLYARGFLGSNDEGLWARGFRNDGGAPGSAGTLDASDRNARTSGALAFARRAGFVIAFLLLWSVT